MHFLTTCRRCVLLLAMCLVCSPVLLAADDTTTTTKESADPLESFNRFTYGFNKQLDRTILKPTAEIYQVLIPPFIRTGITHFFNNLGEIPTVINGVLQGKIAQATADTGRLLLNSTVGVGGLFDVATPIGLDQHHEDFGLTLAHWGWEQSSYLELPILGPSTIRDGLGLVPNYFMTVWPYTFYYLPAYVSYPAFGLDKVNKRANLLKADKIVNTTSLDPYVAIRNAYLQKRANLIDGGIHTTNPLDDQNDIYVDDDDS